MHLGCHRTFFPVLFVLQVWNSTPLDVSIAQHVSWLHGHRLRGAYWPWILMYICDEVFQWFIHYLVEPLYLLILESLGRRIWLEADGPCYNAFTLAFLWLVLFYHSQWVSAWIYSLLGSNCVCRTTTRLLCSWESLHWISESLLTSVVHQPTYFRPSTCISGVELLTQMFVLRDFVVPEYFFKETDEGVLILQ